jgi:argininosuccinate lyase
MTPRSLWGSGTGLDRRLLDLTAADDRPWDSRLLRWDILGSLGHIDGLRASGLLSARDHVRLRQGLRRALAAAEQGRVARGRAHEDVHTAVEQWLTRRLPGLGERLHTGRSRNDQIACDLRLYLKDRLLTLQANALDLVDALLVFARAHRKVLWPGYTHQRRAMPSSVGLWAGAYAEGLLDTIESLPELWTRVDRSPLGSAAGYGVPLPLRREAAAKALGFGGLDRNVATVQGGRGKLEAAVLFWCTQLGHELARLAQDVILYSAEEFGYLTLPADLATGSSIMPHKRNPDLFELTRGRAAALEGDLAAVLQLKSKLSSGYHRDFQLLKEPLMRGIDRTESMLASTSAAVPRVVVNRERCAAGLAGDTLATDEVMRRVEAGSAFRVAYRQVATAIRQNEAVTSIPVSRIVARRRSTGGLGDLGLTAAATRSRKARRWNGQERGRFRRAMDRLAGTVKGSIRRRRRRKIAR